MDVLAERVQRATGARTKTEAVRAALENELARVEAEMPLRQRLARSLALADAMGDAPGDFDMKRFTDEMWGGR
ncbi:type II toxin-antitoxin system VapB family antitoxin [Bosea sp. (in: a-proteobacteria)]|uniref:type II toxin-antitoxin system VapB family antitoxin n=1 Tax=Bosea sp. (in: a-proteobacteria) TaxID=1871050 RepID=UPI003FA526BB